MKLRSKLNAKSNPFADCLTLGYHFVLAHWGSVQQWGLTLSLLNTEHHWQQILSSWRDIQEGNLVSASEAFADLALLNETEGAFRG